NFSAISGNITIAYDLKVSNNRKLSHIGDAGLANIFGTDMKRIDFSHNNLSLIARPLFAKLEHVRELDLSHNAIEIIEDGAFNDLSAVTNINLANNRISSIANVLNVYNIRNCSEYIFDGKVFIYIFFPAKVIFFFNTIFTSSF